MRIKIGAKVYPVGSIDKLTLADIMLLESELQAVGGISGVSTWAEIRDISQEFSGMSSAEAQRSPHMLLMTALAIWGARRSSGERVGFLNSVDIPLSEVEYLTDPQDHKPPTAGKGKGGGGKRKSGTAPSPEMSPAASTPDSSPSAT